MACRVCNPQNKSNDYISCLEHQSDSEDSTTDSECSGNDKPKKHHHRPSRRRRARRRRRYIRMPLQTVVMPNGESNRIKTLAIPNWRCENKGRLITLNPRGRMGRREYGIVTKQMQDTILQHSFCETAGGCFERYKIVKIEKIVHGCAWLRYQNCKEKIAARAGDANERLLFHGSPGVYRLAAAGFDIRFANDGKLGTALYFAQHSSVANQFAFGFYGGDGCRDHKDKECYICVRRIVLCRVTLGNISEFVYSSVGQMSHAPSGYDSVKGVPGEGGFNYPEYAVYKGEQAYPEYLISYKIVRSL